MWAKIFHWLFGCARLWRAEDVKSGWGVTPAFVYGVAISGRVYGDRAVYRCRICSKEEIYVTREWKRQYWPDTGRYAMGRNDA